MIIVALLIVYLLILLAARQEKEICQDRLEWERIFNGED